MNLKALILSFLAACAVIVAVGLVLFILYTLGHWAVAVLAFVVLWAILYPAFTKS